MAKFLNADGLSRLVALIKQALSGKQDKDFVVNVLFDGDTAEYSADKTFAEIKSAYNNDRTIIVRFQDAHYTLSYYEEDDSFSFTQPEGYGNYSIFIFSDDTVSKENSNLQPFLVSGTNIKTVNNNSLLGSGNLSLNDAAIPYDGNGAYALEDATNVQEALDILDDAVNGLDIPPHVVVNEDPTGGSQTIQNPELLNKIESITATESTASGGNNTVTITETNGTTTSFNVKNGTNGGNLGDIDVVDVTGVRTDAVMSQKAVTEYGRKVTAEDLAGTSDWIKARLTDEGWEFGKYVKSNGTTANSNSACVSSFIPMSNFKGHSIIMSYMLAGSNNNSIAWYDSNKTFISGLYYTLNANNSRTVNISEGTTWDNVAYARITLNPNKLSECYIKDGTTEEYYFKGDEYLAQLCKNNELVVDYGLLQDNFLSQETGESSTKTMSQKAITDAINYNINIQHGKGIDTAQGWTWLKLTPKAVSLLNASEKMTFMFSTRGTGSSQDYRYFGFGSSSTSKANTWDADGAWLYWSYSANLGCKQKDYNLNLYNSKRPTPDVWIVTWDRVTGTVSLYDRTTKLTTLTSDNYKCDHFVNANGTIILKTGDNRARIYDIRLFDYDISVLFGNADIAQEIKYLDGAGTPPSRFDGNYGVANDDSSFNSSVNSFQGGGYAATCTYTLDGSDYHIVVKDGVTSSQTCGGKPYYLGRDYKAQINILNFEVVSGVIKTSYDGHTTSILYKITDSNGDEIEDYNNIGVGTYTLTRSSFGPGARLDFYKVSGDVEVVINSTCYYKPISCVFHLKCNTLYNNMLYDEQTDEFYKIYTNYTCTTESTAHVMVDTPQRVIRDNIASSGGLPHYRGEMAVYNGNVYIGMPDYTWKQINNS